MAKLFNNETRDDGARCERCNHESQDFFGIADTKEQAISQFTEKSGYGRGLCPLCIIDEIVLERYEITVNTN